MHHVRREQRLALRIALVVGVVVVAIAAPLILSSSLRLRLGYALNLVPGDEATRLYGADHRIELVVVREEVPVEVSLPIERFTARYIADRRGGTVVLHDIADGRTLDLPLATYDFIAGSDDGEALLFRDSAAPADEIGAVVVFPANGTVRPLPAGETEPPLPGDWETDVTLRAVGCDGVSPRQTWLACVVHGDGFARYWLGDWQLQIRRFGRSGDWTALYRGLGPDPIVGWTPDEQNLLIQTERGIFQIAVPEP